MLLKQSLIISLLLFCLLSSLSFAQDQNLVPYYNQFEQLFEQTEQTEQTEQNEQSEQNEPSEQRE